MNLIEYIQAKLLKHITEQDRIYTLHSPLPLYNEELHNLYSSPRVMRTINSRSMRWAGHEAQMGEKRNTCRILVGNPEGKIPLGRPRRRWMDNIKMDLR
jgi:hypothetical protein